MLLWFLGSQQNAVGASIVFSRCAKREAELSHITAAKAFDLSGRGGIDQSLKAEGLTQRAKRWL